MSKPDETTRGEKEQKEAEDRAKNFDSLSENYRSNVTRELKAFEEYLSQKLERVHGKTLDHRP